MSNRHKQLKTDLVAYAMMAPDLIGLFVFIFLPILMALYFSFFSWNALSTMQFNGIANYIKVFKDVEWWSSVFRTLQYAAIFVLIVVMSSLGIAVLINSLPGRMHGSIRTAIFVPYSVSLIVAGITARFILEEQKGFLNGFLQLLGLEPQIYLSNPSTALFWVAIISSWLIIGYYTVIFTAGLNDIPQSYYEAAKMDGASPFTVFFRITLPQLSNIMTFVVVMTLISSFQVFDQIKVMTNGGPANATTVSVFYIYRQAFEYVNLGYSSALAFTLFIIIFGASMMQFISYRRNSQ